MREQGGTLLLSDSIAIIIIAALLSLLPVVVLLWAYYVREQKPSVPGPAIARFFAMGMMSVALSVLFERGTFSTWRLLSPGTSRVFFVENVDAADISSLFLAALVSFGVIALIEEGVRYVLLRLTFRRSAEFDQLIDGVQFGIALGLGFAFVENTLYFLQLFRGLDFDTLVVVFFLRFLISTVGHMAFGGVMGYFLGLAVVFPTERRALLRRAFLFPWLMHGLFDFLLTVQLSFYTVILLLIPLVMFWRWSRDERMYELHVLRGRRLRFPVPPVRKPIVPRRHHVVEALPAMKSCPNCYVPISESEKYCQACGVRLHRRGLPSVLPFLPREP